MKKIFQLTLLGITISACSSNEAPVTELNKDHSIETTMETKSIKDSVVVLISTQQVYLNGNQIKTIVHSDTIPFPGNKTDVIEDENGNEKTVLVPKEYEFFVTVK